jgi:hypothetical protein
MILRAYPSPGTYAAIVINVDVDLVGGLGNDVEPHIFTDSHRIAQL